MYGIFDLGNYKDIPGIFSQKDYHIRQLNEIATSIEYTVPPTIGYNLQKHNTNLTK